MINKGKIGYAFLNNKKPRPLRGGFDLLVAGGSGFDRAKNVKLREKFEG